VRFLLGYFFFAPGDDPHFKEEVTRPGAETRSTIETR
jgi:hypothetical protein